MSSETSTPEVSVTVESGTPAVEVKMESGPLATVKGTTLPESESEWQQILNQVFDYITPDKLSGFFTQYRQPLTTVGVVVAALVATKLALAIVSAINEIPLLAPMFEVIGIGYSFWFVYRYVLKASNRAELSKDFEALKSEVLGQKK